MVTPENKHLTGIRVLTTSEPLPGAAIDESNIRTVTGGESTIARAVEPFDQCRTKLTIYCGENPKPAGDGVWRRVRIIPWSNNEEGAA
jgi:hypothetical protein